MLPLTRDKKAFCSGVSVPRLPSRNKSIRRMVPISGLFRSCASMAAKQCSTSSLSLRASAACLRSVMSAACLRSVMSTPCAIVATGRLQSAPHTMAEVQSRERQLPSALRTGISRLSQFLPAWAFSIFSREPVHGSPANISSTGFPITDLAGKPVSDSKAKLKAVTRICVSQTTIGAPAPSINFSK